MLVISFFAILGLSLIKDINKAPPEHHECFQIVRAAQKLALSGKQKDEIKTKLGERCSKLKAQREQICTNIVNTKLDEIITMNSEQKNPHFICNAIGFRHPVNKEAQISLADCTNIVEKFRTQFQNFKPHRRPVLNHTRPAIVAKVLEDDKKDTDSTTSTTESTSNDRPFGIRPENGVVHSRLRAGRRMPFAFVPICKELPSESRVACHVISRFVFKDYMKNTNQTPQEVCQHLNQTNYITLV